MEADLPSSFCAYQEKLDHGLKSGVQSVMNKYNKHKSNFGDLALNHIKIFKNLRNLKY